LQSKTTTETQATPAFLFLPFYVDQDIGWTKNWASFTRLEQFTRWRKDAAEYHMGVRPNEYYQAKSGLAHILARASDLRQRRDVLQSVLKQLSDQLTKLDFNIDIDAYRKEIEKLLIYCNKLQKSEEELKKDLARIYNSKAVVDAQIAITTATSKELRGDYSFAVDVPTDHIECPTCGTIHQNSFLERFAIAKDEQRCQELLIELTTELTGYDEQLALLRAKYSNASAELAEAKAILGAGYGDAASFQKTSCVPVSLSKMGIASRTSSTMSYAPSPAILVRASPCGSRSKCIPERGAGPRKHCDGVVAIACMVKPLREDAAKLFPLSLHGLTGSCPHSEHFAGLAHMS
jgi:hypothetical protein